MFTVKYQRPPITGKYVPRPALIGKLNSFLGLPLIVVSAPAGYGKTTLVNVWTEQTGIPVLWVSLDENTGLADFVRYLAGSATLEFTDTLLRTKDLGAGTLFHSFDTITGTLIDNFNSLGQDVILVVDNYEWIRDSQIHELISMLVKRASPILHTVLITRHEPPLPVAGLRARNLLGELRTRDLRFTPEEERVLLEQTAAGKSIDITKVAREMEGWAVGLSLLTASFEQPVEDERISRYCEIGKRYISDYLVYEVLSRVMPSYRDLLFRLALPDRFCADLCDTLFNVADNGLSPISGSTVLRRLERDNLFVSVINDCPGWYRFHPSFRDVLRSCAGENFEADEIEQMHVAAARWFVRNGDVEGALHHAGLIGNSVALELFMEIRESLIEAGNAGLLDRWLKLFPEVLIDSHPGLSLSRAWLMMMNLRLGEMEVILGNIESLLSLNGNASDGFWNELSTLRAMYSFRTGVIYQVADFAGNNEIYGHSSAGLLRVMAVSPNPETFSPSDDAGINHYLNESAVLRGNHGKRDVLKILSLRCLQELIGAYLIDAGKTAGLIRTIARETKKAGYIGMADVYSGLISYHRNDLPEAERYFTAATGVLEHLDADHAVTAYLGLAATEQALRHENETRNVIEKTRSYLLSIPNPDLLPYIDNFEAELLLRRGVLRNREITSPPEWKLLFSSVFYHPSLTRCRYLLSGSAPAEIREARINLERLLETARSNGNMIMSIMALGYYAQSHDMEGNMDKAVKYLEDALSLAERGGCIRIFLDLGLPIARLLLRNGHLHTGISGDILEAFSHGLPVVPNESSRALWGRLTEQEFRVLDYLRQRFSNKEIADQLSITAATVKSHTIHIYQKLNVGGRREAVERASRLGMFLS